MKSSRGWRARTSRRTSPGRPYEIAPRAVLDPHGGPECLRLGREAGDGQDAMVVEQALLDDEPRAGRERGAGAGRVAAELPIEEREASPQVVRAGDLRREQAEIVDERDRAQQIAVHVHAARVEELHHQRLDAQAVVAQAIAAVGARSREEPLGALRERRRGVRRIRPRNARGVVGQTSGGRGGHGAVLDGLVGCGAGSCTDRDPDVAARAGNPNRGSQDPKPRPFECISAGPRSA